MALLLQDVGGIAMGMCEWQSLGVFLVTAARCEGEAFGADGERVAVTGAHSMGVLSQLFIHVFVTERFSESLQQLLVLGALVTVGPRSGAVALQVSPAQTFTGSFGYRGVRTRQ